VSPSLVRKKFPSYNRWGQLDTVSNMATLLRRVLTPCKAAKESSVKRRQFIDAMNYHFNRQFKKYKAEHHRAEREDSWTRGIISKVHCEYLSYHLGRKFNGHLPRSPWYVSALVSYQTLTRLRKAIGDAIDDGKSNIANSYGPPS